MGEHQKVKHKIGGMQLAITGRAGCKRGMLPDVCSYPYALRVLFFVWAPALILVLGVPGLVVQS